MSTRLTIGNQVIVFPSPGTDANWAAAVDDFAQAVADQLSAIASPFDISPRVQILSSDANVNLNVTSAIFPSGSVRGFSFNYAVYRTNGVTAIAEQGFVNGAFNTLDGTWGIEQEFTGPRQSDGTAYNTFSMSGDQLQITTAAIGGSYDAVESKLSYAAKTILVSDI